MKHFEDLWTEAEELFENDDQQLSEIITEIKYDLDDLLIVCSSNNPTTEAIIPPEDLLGDIIFNLTKISKKLNINTYTALNNAITEEKIETLEENEEIIDNLV